MSKKLIAGFMAALIASVTAITSVLAVPTLDQYPTFLGMPGTDVFVVVGDSVASDDVVGAVNLAIRLAEVSVTEKPVAGVSVQVEGKSKDVAIGNDLATVFGSTLTWRQLPQLKDTTVTFLGKDYRYTEELTVPDSVVAVEATPSEEDGYVYLQNPAEATTNVQYTLTFRKDFEDAISEDNPLVITILGKEFEITKVTSDSFTALVGTRVALTSIGDTATVEGRTIELVAAKDGSWATFKVDGVTKTADVNTNPTISVGDFKITLRSVRVAEVPEKQVVVEIVAGKETEVTYENDDEFPGAPDWKFTDISFTINNGKIGKDSTIGVKYDPEEAKDIKVGDKVSLPGNTLDIQFVGTTATAYADITAKPGPKIKVYDVNDPDTLIAEGYSIELSSTEKSVFEVPIDSINVYDKIWLVRQADDEWMVAVYDSVLGKYVNADPSVNAVGNLPLSSIHKDQLGIRFGEGVAELDLDRNGANDYLLIVAASNSIIGANFQWTDTDKFKLGDKKGEAESTDILYDEDGELTADAIDVGTREYTVMTEYGIIIKGVKSNAAADKLVISLPNVDGIKATIAIGKVTGVTAATSKEIAPIRTPIAALASQADKTKNLILVGGPCANRLVQELVNAGKLDASYTCAGLVMGSAWTPNTGYIIVTDGFTTGKYAVVVAGTSAADTRLASEALQKYDVSPVKEAIAGKSAVKIVGTAVATATISGV